MRLWMRTCMLAYMIIWITFIICGSPNSYLGCTSQQPWAPSSAGTAGTPKDTNFHWIRMDSAGNWSHKPGGTPVRNTEPGQPGQWRIDPGPGAST